MGEASIVRSYAYRKRQQFIGISLWNLFLLQPVPRFQRPEMPVHLAFGLREQGKMFDRVTGSCDRELPVTIEGF